MPEPLVIAKGVTEQALLPALASRHGAGEALASFLEEEGRPSIVERAYVLPPASQIAPLGAQQRVDIIKASGRYGQYETARDRESACEKSNGHVPVSLNQRARRRARVVRVARTHEQPRRRSCEGILEAPPKAPHGPPPARCGVRSFAACRARFNALDDKAVQA